MGFNVVYTTSEFSPSLNDDHEKLLAGKKSGLVNSEGTVLRIMDFAPDFECMTHRTQNLDYGIVLSGSIEMVLDSGLTTLMHPGDVAVQRATMHAWRNPTKIDWSIFVLQDCQPLKLDEKVLKEDLGKGTKGLPPNDNDNV